MVQSTQDPEVKDLSLTPTFPYLDLKVTSGVLWNWQIWTQPGSSLLFLIIPEESTKTSVDHGLSWGTQRLVERETETEIERVRQREREGEEDGKTTSQESPRKGWPHGLIRHQNLRGEMTNPNYVPLDSDGLLNPRETCTLGPFPGTVTCSDSSLTKVLIGWEVENFLPSLLPGLGSSFTAASSGKVSIPCKWNILSTRLGNEKSYWDI